MVPHELLWQVLDGLGIHRRILDIIKSLYAHDSAAVRSSQGLSAIFTCLMGVKQGCPYGRVEPYTAWTVCGNLSKTKIVVFETRRSDCTDFIFNAKPVERVDSYRYLGFTFHATKSLTYGAGQLVSAAKKAVHAMRRRCAQLCNASSTTVWCYQSSVMPVKCGLLIRKRA